MAKKKQITITLPNKVGELEKLAKNLASQKVNIEALSVSNLLDVGVVRFVCSNYPKAKQAINKMGATIVVDDVAAVSLPNEVGVLAKLAADLKKKKINIDYIYGSVAPGASEAICVIKAPDLDAVEALFKS